MAQLARRGWSEIKDEVIKMAGGLNYNTYGSRVEQAIWNAYQHLALTYHHYEFNTETTLLLESGQSTLSVPPDAYVLMAVIELDSTSNLPVRQLELRQSMLNRGLFLQNVTGQPDYYGRLGGVLYLNRPTDTARKYLIVYYRFPERPDFTTGVTPEFSDLWDGPLLYRAAAEAALIAFGGEIAAFYLQMLESFLKAQGQPSLASYVATDLPDKDRTMSQTGGSQA